MSVKPIPSSSTPAPEDIVQFADSHRVSLLAGDYELSVKQQVASDQPGKSFSDTWSATQLFSVQAERFLLPASAVRATFPPAGGQGDYWHTLPHVVLERSTLPWERTAEKNPSDVDTAAPWLALLVFHPDDQPPRAKSADWASVRSRLGIPEEKTDKSTDRTKEITISKTLADLLVPSLEELNLLTHVRRRLAMIGEKNGYASQALAEAFVRGQIGASSQQAVATDHLPTGYTAGWLLRSHEAGEAYKILKKGRKFFCFHVAHEAATVLANRLPAPGSRNQVHLVSLEGRYVNGSFDAGTGTTVSFVSLHQWDFFCESAEHTFKGLLENLNKQPDGSESRTEWGLPTSRSNGTEPAVAMALNNGYIPLKHAFREGSKSVSWYHGPLVPHEPDTSDPASNWSADDDTLNVRHADQLLLFDVKTGLHDVSYAAAWELGRTLSLANSKLALNLLHYKRQHAHQLHAVRHLADYGYHLPLSSKARKDHVDEAREQSIRNWLDELTVLQHVPFNYLVPDPDLIPPESIRFFTVDRRWVECLRDGAFSVGRVLEQDAHRDRKLHGRHPFAEKLPAESGFLLRSSLVAGWPDLQFTGYNATEAPTKNAPLPDPGADEVMRPFRTEKLAPDLLLVLFPGEVKSVDFFLPPEALHFGLDEPAADVNSSEPEKLVKVSRDPLTGKELTTTPIPLSTADFSSQSLRTLNINKLATTLVGRDHSAGRLALQLVSGTTLVRFIRQAAPITS